MTAGKYMLSKNSIQTMVGAMVILTCTFLHAETEVHHFDVESGMINYDIRGGGQLTPETNLTIKGSAKLRFKAWGTYKREEEQGVILTTGAIRHKKNVHRLEKTTDDKIITVDYENEQLLERKKGDTVSNLSIETKGLQQGGKEVIAGYLCDIWIGAGIRKCIYKGIVLRQESRVMGLSYVRVATDVNFDINISSDKCTVPDYPIQEFALLRENIKTKNKYKPENFCKILKDMSHETGGRIRNAENVKLKDKQRVAFINDMGKNIFTEQKKLLPELLSSMKKSRICLQTVESAYEANHCMEDVNPVKLKLGIKGEGSIVFWDPKTKAKTLDSIEDELMEIQSRMPCIKRAKNITDLSSCMK